jgi:hypothetical protein
MSRDEKFFLDTDFSEYSDNIEDMNIIPDFCTLNILSKDIIERYNED